MFIELIRYRCLSFAILLIVVLAASMPITGAESGVWNYRGNAYTDKANGYLVLTQNVDSQAGAIWLNDTVFGPFTANFKYEAGGGSGADGLVFMFYKEIGNYLPGGEDLGFDGKGYGIEFDSFTNGQDDVQGKHIALIKDITINHLAYTSFNGVNDNQWHDVKIEVSDGGIVVYVDKRNVLSKNMNFYQYYGGIGFSAATGASNDWHKIDDVSINYGKNVTYLNSS